MRKPALIFMTPVIRDGAPETGGEVYTERALETLRERWDVDTLTWDDLGMTNRAPAHAFARRSLEVLEERGVCGPVLEDTVMYAVGAPLNRALKARGFGPIIGFGQAVYPLRATGLVGQAGRFAYLARYLHTCDGHIVVSRYVETISKRLGVRRPVSVVYPGFDLVEELRTLASMPRELDDRGRIRIVTAGTYIPSKGQHLLVEAVHTLLSSRPTLRDRISVACYGTEVADRDYFASVRALVERRGLGDVVELHGFVAQHDLWKAFAEADIFVFMARGEGLGMVVGEAMLLGCAPIVTNTGPMKELIEDGVSGVLAPLRAAAVAAALDELVSDGERRRRMSAAATAAGISCLHSWEWTSERFADALARLIATGG